MSERKVGIVSECVCDLPKSYLREHDIDIVYFLIKTDSGVFTDTDEITSENIISYMESGGEKTMSSPPPTDVYFDIFEKNLKKYDELVYVAISRKISASCEKAEEAVGKMGEKGKRVHIFDSANLSTGLGHVVMKAVELAEEGKSANEIIPALEKYRSRVSTTFITLNANYIIRGGRFKNSIKNICSMLNAHPVMRMQNGQLKIKSVIFGNYEKAYLRYVRRELRHYGKINKNTVYVTHVGCSVKMLERIKKEIRKKCNAENIVITKASATISSSCGPLTFGILFVNN